MKILILLYLRFVPSLKHQTIRFGIPVNGKFCWLIKNNCKVIVHNYYRLLGCGGEGHGAEFTIYRILNVLPRILGKAPGLIPGINLNKCLLINCLFFQVKDLFIYH